MLRNRIFLMVIFLVVNFMVYGNRNTVRGIVTDLYNGNPMPGVTVHIKGTHRAAVTDEGGGYHLHPNEGQLLVFSFVGYNPYEVVYTESMTRLDVQLEESSVQVKEIVVNGALGLRRTSRELSGGAQIVTQEELTQGNPVNPITGLSARVSGLRINVYDSKVDPSVQVVLRGNRSLRGNNSPLFVVDGVPVPEINRINPNDIANVTVLKGANSAALYGSEGVNGVIMITTRHGERGKGVVTYSNSTGFSQVYKIPPAQTQFGQGVDGEYRPTQYQSWGPAFDGSLKPFGPVLPDGTQPMVVYATPDKDMRENFFQTGVSVQNNLSLSGGDNVSTYYLSMQDVMVNGIIPEDESRRTGVRFNGARSFGRLSSSYNVNYTLTNNNTTPDGPWVTMYQMPANFPVEQMKNWKDANSIANPHNFFTDQHRNPYFQIDNLRNELIQQTVNSKLEFDYKLAPWVSAMWRGGLYSTVQETRNTIGKFEATGRRNIAGSVTDGSRNFRRLNSDFILTFNQVMGQLKNRLVLGTNLRDDYTKTISVGSNNLLLPGLFNPGSRTGELNGGASISQYRQTAIYGEYSAGWKDIWFLNFTGRNEWVSVLSKDNRSYFYPGVSTSFVYSEAFPVLSENTPLTFGKFYLSYNKTGNVNLNPYALNNPYSQTNGFPYGNLVGFTPSSTYPNPDIEPEFVTSWEIGTQLTFFNNRLSIEGGYIYSDSKGQIFNANTSRATGYSTATVNAGRMTNNIIELAVGGDVVKTLDVKWNLAFNYTYIRNDVKELFEGLESFAIFRQSYAAVGEQYPALYVKDYARDPQGRVIVDATTGHPMPSTELTHLGTMVPPTQMGLSSTFTYKNINIGMLFDCRLGGWMYSEVANRMIQNGTHPMTVEYNRKPFVFPNSVVEISEGVFVPNTSVLTQGGGNATFWTDHVAEYHINFAAPGDFLKMREANISYAIPKSLLSRQKVISDATIGVYATNLFLITHKDNDLGDPEYLYNNASGYYSWRQVPPYRTAGFNVNIVF
jgi:TonB-linked SusC/RagA family outer membrane protein